MFVFLFIYPCRLAKSPVSSPVNFGEFATWTLRRLSSPTKDVFDSIEIFLWPALICLTEGVNNHFLSNIFAQHRELTKGSHTKKNIFSMTGQLRPFLKEKSYFSLIAIPLSPSPLLMARPLKITFFAASLRLGTANICILIAFGVIFCSISEFLKTI